jgi:predicted dehydrogenase
MKKERMLRLFQPDAYVAIDYDQRKVRIVRRTAAGAPGALPNITAEEHDAGEGDPLRDEIAAFVDAVRKRGTPLVGGREGLRALELAERIAGCIPESVAAITEPSS